MSLYKGFFVFFFRWTFLCEAVTVAALLSVTLPVRSQGVITTILGPPSSLASCADHVGWSYKPNSPTDMLFDPQGRLIVAEFAGNRIVRFEADGSSTVLTGTGKPGFSGDGGSAINAQIDSPFYLAWDPQGRLVISDSLNGRIRRIETDGTIQTIAGGGATEEDGADALSTRIRRVGGIAYDAQGLLYYADMTAVRVRRVNADGTVTTIAAGPQDTPKGQEPTLLGAGGIAFDDSGNLYVTEFGAARVRKITPNGVATTLAGTGHRGFSGDGGPALDASFDNPWGLQVRSDGVYVVDAGNQRVRRIGTDGMVNTVAGGGSTRIWADGGSSTTASVAGPCCLIFDAAGNLWVNDVRGGIRKVTFGALPSGDLDGDGAITPADARIMLGFLVGVRSPMAVQSQASDMNGDGKVNLLDAVALLPRACTGVAP